MGYANELIDQAWVSAMMIRWGLALRYLEAADMDSLPEEHGIRVLVKHDFPLLMQELSRLRPELAH